MAGFDPTTLELLLIFQEQRHDPEQLGHAHILSQRGPKTFRLAATQAHEYMRSQPCNLVSLGQDYLPDRMEAQAFLTWPDGAAGSIAGDQLERDSPAGPAVPAASTDAEYAMRLGIQWTPTKSSLRRETAIQDKTPCTARLGVWRSPAARPAALRPRIGLQRRDMSQSAGDSKARVAVRWTNAINAGPRQDSRRSSSPGNDKLAIWTSTASPPTPYTRSPVGNAAAWAWPAGGFLSPSEELQMSEQREREAAGEKRRAEDERDVARQEAAEAKAQLTSALEMARVLSQRLAAAPEARGDSRTAMELAEDTRSWCQEIARTVRDIRQGSDAERASAQARAKIAEAKAQELRAAMDTANARAGELERQLEHALEETRVANRGIDERTGELDDMQERNNDLNDKIRDLERCLAKYRQEADR